MAASSGERVPWHSLFSFLRRYLGSAQRGCCAQGMQRRGCGALTDTRARANVAATRRQAGIDLEGPVRVYDIFAQQVREALLSGRGRGHNRSPRPSALRTPTDEHTGANTRSIPPRSLPAASPSVSQTDRGISFFLMPLPRPPLRSFCG